MRPIYRSRRDTLLAALARSLPGLRPAGASAGLHVLAWLPDEWVEAAIVAAAAANGIAIPGVGPRWMHGGPPALVFGNGAITEPAIEPAVARLATIVAAVR